MSGAPVATAQAWRPLNQTLLREHGERLDALRNELMRWPTDSVEASRLRNLIAHYERLNRDLEQSSDAQRRDDIGPGPTLGGDGKPILDC